jgi:phosphatidate cytidylyltransferase
LLAIVAGIGLAFVGEMMRYRQPGRSTGSMALSVLVLAYAGLLPSFLVNLRLFHDHRWGMVALISLVVIVKGADTGAYFVGRRFGKHKLAPVLSPGKTVEGAIGAFFAAAGAAALCYYGIVPLMVGDDSARGPLWGWLLLSLLLAGSGMLGDLAESLLKRDAGRKDSSRWLPGLGGVLDILDSVVFAAAPAYFFFATGLIGPA